MSFSIYWRRVPRPEAHAVATQVKYPIAKVLGSHDGSLREEWIFTKGGSEVLVLKTLAVSGPEEQRRGAQELLDAIEKHGEIHVWIGEWTDYSGELAREEA